MRCEKPGEFLIRGGDCFTWNSKRAILGVLPVRGVITPGRVVSEGDGKENRKEEIGGRFFTVRYGTGAGVDRQGGALGTVPAGGCYCLSFLVGLLFLPFAGPCPDLGEKGPVCSRAAVFRAVVFPTFRGQGSWAGFVGQSFYAPQVAARCRDTLFI